VKGRLPKKMVKGEKGQALIVVLIMMLFGSLIIVPVMAHISTGLKVGQEVYEEKMYLLYAADAGVEDALWQMQNDQLPVLFEDYDEFAYYDSENPEEYMWTYNPADIYEENVNDKAVEVSFRNMWMPKDIDIPEAAEARSIVEGGKLIVAGALSGVSETEYQIKIAFYWANEGERDSLRVQELGIWLPSGFTYNDNCNLTGGCAPSSVEIGPYKSGQAVVWNFSSQPQLALFPGGTSYPMVKTITFEFSGPEGQKPGAAVSWIDTIGVSGIDYTWDADVKVYAVTSVAGEEEAEGEGEVEVAIEAYAAKIEMRKLGSAISGDYCAIGDTLETHTGSNRYRNRLYMQNSNTIATGDIPASATVKAAYLYWSGWIDYHYRYKSGYSWRWGEIPELEYPEDPTPENLTALLEDAAKVNKVSFGIVSDMREVTADDWQVAPITQSDVYEGTWFYGCFYDATEVVQEFIDDEKVDPNGAGTYFVKHADSVINQQRVGYEGYYFNLYNTSDSTGYPLATPAHTASGYGTYYPTRYQATYAGWSLVIIYSSPETKGHQLYLYDIATPGFTFVLGWHNNPDFDGDGEEGGMISGFIAPDAICEEAYAAHLTCFVGEGDEGGDYTGDYIRVNGTSLSNAQSPANDVWNARSPGLSVPGVDIDTFTVSYPTIDKGDTWAQVDLPTDTDGFMLVYIILSFRSKVASGGTLSYLVR
jgi:hypothetical protein